MTTLPNVSDIIGGTTTEGQFQSAMDLVYKHIAESPGASTPEELAITLGSVTPTKGFIVVDTENTSPTDDLNNVLATNLGDRLIFISSKASSRVVTIKHLATGSGQLSMIDGADVVLSDPKQFIVFRYNSVDDTWYELYKNFGLYLPTTELKSALRTSLGITDVATKAIGTSAGQVPTADLLGALAFLSTVTSNEITDGAVTLSKLAGYPAGSILYWDSSGNPQVLPPGNDGLFLKTRSIGQPPEWSEVVQDLTFSPGDNIWYQDDTDKVAWSSRVTAYKVLIPRGGTIRVSVQHAVVGSTAGFRRGTVYVYKNGVYTGLLSYTSTTSGAKKTAIWDLNINRGDVVEIRHSNGLDVDSYVSSNTYTFWIKAAEFVDQVMAV